LLAVPYSSSKALSLRPNMTVVPSGVQPRLDIDVQHTGLILKQMDKSCVWVCITEKAKRKNVYFMHSICRFQKQSHVLNSNSANLFRPTHSVPACSFCASSEPRPALLTSPPPRLLTAAPWAWLPGPGPSLACCRSFVTWVQQVIFNVFLRKECTCAADSLSSVPKERTCMHAVCTSDWLSRRCLVICR
jgi:hypothetical protein